MDEHPKTRRRYHGGFTDTDRWEHFVSRPKDVFVSTPPKCGTTWTTTIVAMLCHGKTDVNSAEAVQWIDATVVPIDEAVQSLEAQTVRRCIKSHTPFDGMPYFKDSHYIAVYRHPMDMMFSLRNHTSNAKSAPADDPFLGDAKASLEHFVDAEVDFEDYDDSTLEAMVCHYLSFVTPPIPKNVLTIHYADLLADAHGEIVKIANFIGLGDDDGLIDAVFEATKFKTMKKQAERYAPFATRDFWHSSTNFFDSGGTNKWAGKLDESDFAHYRGRVAELLSEDTLAWLENGSTTA